MTTSEEVRELFLYQGSSLTVDEAEERGRQFDAWLEKVQRVAAVRALNAAASDFGEPGIDYPWSAARNWLRGRAEETEEGLL